MADFPKEEQGIFLIIRHPSLDFVGQSSKRRQAVLTQGDGRLKGLIGSGKIGSGVLFSGVLLTLSIAGHAALLTLPMPDSSRSASFPAMSSDVEANMAVVVLPKNAGVPAELSATPPVKTAPEGTIAPESFPASPRIEETLSSAIAPEPSPPVEPELEEEATISPPTQGFEPEAEISTPDNPAMTPPVDTPLQTAADPPGALLAYGTGFPHLDGATAGCFGTAGCRRVSGVGSYREVGRSLIASLETQGYQVRLRDDLEDTGRNVYELTAADPTLSTQYLIVFSDPADGSAVYVLSNEVLTLRDLQSLQA